MFATTFEGKIRLLNDRHPMLYTSQERAKDEADRFARLDKIAIGVIEVREADFVLDECSIDNFMPKNWNSNYPWVAPNDSYSVYANQGTREGTVLAVIGAQALIEYEMPQGSTALRLITCGMTSYKTMSYHKVPARWLAAMVSAGTEWEGKQQGNFNRRDARLYRQRDYQPVASAAEMLAAKRTK